MYEQLIGHADILLECWMDCVYGKKFFNDVPWGVGGFLKEIVPLNEHC